VNNFDLIVVRPKINKLKIAIFIIIGLIIVALFGMLGIYTAKQNYEKRISKYYEDAIEVKEKIKLSEKEKRKIPIYSLESQQAITNIYKNQEKVVYLTFDDGPSKTVTPLILDLLKQEQIKAIFFVLGSRVELNPDLVKRAYDEGHYIANHGYSHVYSNIYASTDSILNEYNATEQAIRNAIGVQEYNCHLFRFPGGSIGGKYNQVKSDVKPVLEQNQIAYLDWNSLTSDSAGAKTKETMLESLVQTTENKNTVVLLMHDAGDKILTYEVLPEVIQFFKDRGYTFGDMYNIMSKTKEN